MDVYQKDVMAALVGAAGGTAGFGLSLIGVVAGLIGLTKTLRPALRRWIVVAVLAFLVALLSSVLSLVWLAVSAWVPGWMGLGVVYVLAISFFLISVLAFVVIFPIFAVELLRSDVFQQVRTAIEGLRHAALRFNLAVAPQVPDQPEHPQQRPPEP